MSIIDFRNSTDLQDDRLLSMCQQAASGWRIGNVTLRVRYSRGADFSGTCIYADRRVFVNLGRHLVYPYHMGTHVARAKSARGYWSKPVYSVELASGYQVVLFVFLHEVYHLLVKRAGRNVRQKESMCDRFATRVLVDHYGATVRTEKGDLAQRESWDFQDVERFVAAARDRRTKPKAALRPPAQEPHREKNEQLLFFPV